MAQPKLHDVARVAGVSPTTVSRVLNNRGYISQQTRDKVYDAMASINYQPNAIARSLQGAKAHLVGLIFPTVANPFYGELASLIESRLADEGYKVVLCNSQDRPEAEQRYLDMLVSNQVNGIITGAHSDIIANSPYLAAPLVTIDRAEGGRYPNVRCDNLQGAFEATQLLIESGARRIVHFTSTLSAENLRQQGYLRAVEQAQLIPDIVELGFAASAEQHRTRIFTYLDRHREVDAVFASNDSYAAMALQWAEQERVSVPDSLQVMGFDGTTTVRGLLPHLATVVQPIEELARAAVDRLLHLINASETEAVNGEGSSEVLPITIHRGTTVRNVG